jgi:hypothetical protein
MAEITLPNGQVVEVADDAQSYQVVVSLPSGETTTANAIARVGEDKSELERLLAGEIIGREGYKGATEISAITLDGPGDGPGFDALQDAENQVLAILRAFLGDQSFEGLYTKPTAEGPKFVQEEADYVPTLDEAKNLYPYLPPSVVEVIVNTWTETGDVGIALAQARATDDFRAAFPGIAREDGSLRMTETQYVETVDRMQDALRTFNLNPDVFAQDIAEAIAGDVSAKEFEERLQIGYNQVFNNIPQVQEVYRAEFGLDLSDEAIFGMFISPELSESVLQNQVLVSQIAAEAEVAGVGIGLTAAQRFVQEGITQQQARQLFTQTAQLAPGLQAVAGQAGIEAPTEEQIARGLGGLSVEDINIIKSLEARAATESAPVLGAAQARTGEVVGLEEA